MHYRLAPLAMCILLVLVMGVVGGCSAEGPTAYTRRSPSGAYTAVVSGYLNAPKIMFKEHPVRTELRSASGDVIGRLEIYRSDFLDDAFAKRYEPPAWLSDHVLRFRSARVSTASGVGELVVDNRSKERIKWLRIGTEDIFVVADVMPGTRLSVPASRPLTSEVVFVNAEGYADGGKIAYQAKNFQQMKSPPGWGGRYVVIVENGRIQLSLEQSPEKLR